MVPPAELAQQVATLKARIASLVSGFPTQPGTSQPATPPTPPPPPPRPAAPADMVVDLTKEEVLADTDSAELRKKLDHLSSLRAQMVSCNIGDQFLKLIDEEAAEIKGQLQSRHPLWLRISASLRKVGKTKRAVAEAMAALSTATQNLEDAEAVANAASLEYDVALAETSPSGQAAPTQHLPQQPMAEQACAQLVDILSVLPPYARDMGVAALAALAPGVMLAHPPPQLVSQSVFELGYNTQVPATPKAPNEEAVMQSVALVLSPERQRRLDQMAGWQVVGRDGRPVPAGAGESMPPLPGTIDSSAEPPAAQPSVQRPVAKRALRKHRSDPTSPLRARSRSAGRSTAAADGVTAVGAGAADLISPVTPNPSGGIEVSSLEAEAGAGGAPPRS